MKKLFVTSAMSVLFLAASVFAFSGASANDSCPLRQAAESGSADYSKVVVASGESCCSPGAACCKGGACCKNKSK